MQMGGFASGNRGRIPSRDPGGEEGKWWHGMEWNEMVRDNTQSRVPS